ncbi:hypothetical protein CTI12_AA056010 [Artemisia annua]|uniref:Uncharacterized protein n=1 Tax=Artemisia annua TaxID=35608 RepID=A0A2U1Q9T6_ARTAN|nr:hypothetical protein CTI12_AA056010 [Artemisia annua]
MAPRNTATANSKTATTQATIRKMVNDSVASALGIRATALTRPMSGNKSAIKKKIIATRKCTCKGFTRYQPIYSKGTLRKGQPKSLEKKVAPSETRTLRETMIVFRNLLEQEIKRDPVQGDTDHQQKNHDTQPAWRSRTLARPVPVQTSRECLWEAHELEEEEPT